MCVLAAQKTQISTDLFGIATQRSITLFTFQEFWLHWKQLTVLNGGISTHQNRKNVRRTNERTKERLLVEKLKTVDRMAPTKRRERRIAFVPLLSLTLSPTLTHTLSHTHTTRHLSHMYCMFVVVDVRDCCWCLKKLSELFLVSDKHGGAARVNKPNSFNWVSF